MTAYDETTVPDDAQLPYITYTVLTGALDNTLLLNGNLWYRDTSWKDISQKADLIAETIGYGYKIIPFDDGYLYITRGQPFAQRMSEPSDTMIRRIYINLNAEFLSAY